MGSISNFTGKKWLNDNAVFFYIWNGRLFNCMFFTGKSRAGCLFGDLKNIVSLELNSVTINVK